MEGQCFVLNDPFKMPFHGREGGRSTSEKDVIPLLPNDIAHSSKPESSKRRAERSTI